MSEIKSNSSISSIITTSYNSYSGTFFPNIKFHTNRILNNSKKKEFFYLPQNKENSKYKLKKHPIRYYFQLKLKKSMLLMLKIILHF